VISAKQALERLKEGNRRFVTGSGMRDLAEDHRRRLELVRDQAPFAIVLGCSDSRVPLEIVFDQGLGDLFVIRVAGNIVAPSQIGSIEFAADRFGTRLVVVLGHSQCGAVAASLEHLQRRTPAGSPNLGFIVNSIRPSLEPLVQGRGDDIEGLMDEAVRINIRASVRQLQKSSSVLEGLTRESGLMILGAEYSLETGVVTFLDDPG